MAIPEKYRGVAYGGVEYDTRTHYVSWNGDLRERGDRWNGNTEWEDQGFHSRGVRTVEGTTPPERVRPVEVRGAIQPLPKGHSFEPVSRRPKSPEAEEMFEARQAHDERVRLAAVRDLQKRNLKQK